MGERPESQKYKGLLKQNGIVTEELPSEEEFNSQNDISLVPNEHPKFTFIDLFAGIGGFRIAMQSLGGKCVFSSEWDEPAKETYFQNYGEVPFGDITKQEKAGEEELLNSERGVLRWGFRIVNGIKDHGIKKTKNMEEILVWRASLNITRLKKRNHQKRENLKKLRN